MITDQQSGRGNIICFEPILHPSSRFVKRLHQIWIRLGNHGSKMKNITGTISRTVFYFTYDLTNNRQTGYGALYPWRWNLRAIDYRSFLKALNCKLACCCWGRSMGSFECNGVAPGDRESHISLSAIQRPNFWKLSSKEWIRPILGASVNLFKHHGWLEERRSTFIWLYRALMPL